MKDYEKFSDEELLTGLHQGQKELEEYLMDKYKGRCV